MGIKDHDKLFVYFTGEENEKEFLSKCIEQWDKLEGWETETQKLICLGGLFSEIRHRLEEL